MLGCQGMGMHTVPKRHALCLLNMETYAEASALGSERTDDGGMLLSFRGLNSGLMCRDLHEENLQLGIANLGS